MKNVMHPKGVMMGKAPKAPKARGSASGKTVRTVMPGAKGKTKAPFGKVQKAVTTKMKGY